MLSLEFQCDLVFCHLSPIVCLAIPYKYYIIKINIVATGEITGDCRREINVFYNASRKIKTLRMEH
jgi:hypothetical protein